MSSVKKPNRRGRQKKQILDQEDLQKYQQFQKAVQQGRINPNQNDIFDTAKLDKNYFVRQQNKTSHQQSQVFNFDNDIQSNTLTNQTQTKQQESQVNQKGTTNKKRDYRRRKKNQNIFDQDDDNYLQTNGSQIQPNQTTNNKLLKQKPYNQQQKLTLEQKQPQIPIKNLQFQKEVSSAKKQSPQKKNNLHETQFQIKKQQNQEQQQQQSDIQDDFNNVIKQKEEQSQEEQKVYLLHKQIQKIPKQQKKQFYYKTLPANHVAYGYFKRFSSGLSEIYQLCGQDHRPLLFCQNQRGCIGANYYISMTKQMDKNNPNYLGKLRGNAAGSIYYLYDDGVQPKNQLNRSDWRVSMAAIQYENNFMGMNGPRKIKATTPSAKLLEDADTFKLSQQESLLSFQPPIVTRFRNKTPKWNEKLRSYALNFGGRVKLASIKNFILIDNQYQIQDEDQADSMVVFGKIDENTFSLEYRHPLSLFQAFGIIMSQFDFKINCE